MHSKSSLMGAKPSVFKVEQGFSVTVASEQFKSHVFTNQNYDYSSNFSSIMISNCQIREGHTSSWS